MLEDKKITCDFCEKEENYDISLNMAALTKWSAGVRGKTYPVIPYSGFMRETVKHSCPDALCQARLRVWTRS